MTDTSRTIAKALLEIGAVGFNFDHPIEYKSGILSPVYADNRKWPFHPRHWKMVIEGFVEYIRKHHIEFDVIAGIESAGIPHSAVLGYVMGKPSVFTRKQVKDHGTKKMVEGGEVKGKQVLLLEDLVTTGGSSLTGVESLRNEKAKVTDCIVIVTYGFTEAEENFLRAGVKLHSLTDFGVLFDEALEQGLIDKGQKVIVEEWRDDPWRWTKSYTKRRT